jgi:transmembrane sensor
MNDLTARVADAKSHATPHWSAEREQLVRARVDVKAAMRRKTKRAAVAALALLSLFAAAFVVWHRAPVPAPQAAARPTAATLLRLEDGSTVVAGTPDARVEPVEIVSTVASMRLLTGSARFSVTPNKNRTFIVMARDVTVTVLGTLFAVNLEPGGVRVTVERGRVHVAWPAGERVLNLGEEAFIADTPVVEERVVPEKRADVAERAALPGRAPAEAPPGAERPAPEGELSSPGRATDVAATPNGPTESTVPGGAAWQGARTTARSGASTGAASSPGRDSWRALAEEGDYAGAYKLMQPNWAGAVRDEPGDLLLAADVARLGGHPERAIGPLQRVVGQHATDSRAPLAAFTLGRTLLDQLGRPREAASAFATARRLEPRGAMAQDALAREVESWSRAGEASLARERAEEYVSRYPKGRRIGAVRRLGGLD